MGNRLIAFAVTRLELKKKLNRVVRDVLAHERTSVRNAVVEVVLVSEARIQEFNHRYRAKNAPTDVLSFRADDAPGDAHKFLGEVVVCPAYIRRQARAYGVTYREELVRMTIHGTLHLLGYDHERAADRRRMLPRQERYVARVHKKLHL